MCQLSVLLNICFYLETSNAKAGHINILNTFEQVSLIRNPPVSFIGLCHSFQLFPNVSPLNSESFFYLKLFLSRALGLNRIQRPMYVKIEQRHEVRNSIFVIEFNFVIEVVKYL
jgi:hypothetical protein